MKGGATSLSCFWIFTEGHSFGHLAANQCIYYGEEPSGAMSPVLHSGVEQMQ